MSQQQAELHKEKMQRTLTALQKLWWCRDTDEDDILFLASELGLQTEFYQLIKKQEKQYA